MSCPFRGLNSRRHSPVPKLGILVDDPETRAIWEAANQAAREVASWPAWKRGESPQVSRREEILRMSEIIFRSSAVAIPETFGLEPNKDPAKEPTVVGRVRCIDGEHTGREITLYLSLVGGAAEITMKQLRAMGWTCNDITALTGLGGVKFDLTGKNEEYNGKVKIRYSVWPARVRPTLRAEDQKVFAAKFKALAAGLRDKDGKSAVVEVSDANRAPETLPEARAYNGAASTTPATESDAAVSDPRSMFA